MPSKQVKWPKEHLITRLFKRLFHTYGQNSICTFPERMCDECNYELEHGGNLCEIRSDNQLNLKILYFGISYYETEKKKKELC